MTEKELVSLPVGTWVMVDLGGPLVVAQRIGVPVRKETFGGPNVHYMLQDGDPNDPGGMAIRDPRMASLPTRELIDRWWIGREGPINIAIRKQLERQLGKQEGKK